jgi:hypothetical protein
MDTTFSQLAALAAAGRSRQAERDLRTLSLLVAVAGGKDAVKELVTRLEHDL